MIANAAGIIHYLRHRRFHVHVGGYNIGKCDITNGAGATRADATFGEDMVLRMP